MHFLLAAILAACFFSPQVLAHPGHGIVTLYEGILHPISGLDHFLVAVAVGIWAAVSSEGMNNSFIYAGPLGFLGGIFVGALSGQLGVIFPFCEEGILISLLLLGICIFTSIRSQLRTGCWVLLLFGAFHGNAHGIEVNHHMGGGFAILGFIVSTGFLHCVGIGVISLIRKRLAQANVNNLLRWVGAGLIGTVFLI